MTPNRTSTPSQPQRRSCPLVGHVAALGIALTVCGFTLSAADNIRVPGDRLEALVYQAIDISGAALTNAQGINARGDIVGFYIRNAVTHGFLIDGTVTTIDYPGAAYTDARGINASGDVVGAYRLPGEPPINFHGYLRTRGGEFRTIDVPGHINAIPQRITSSGLIVGCRHDADLMSTMRGVAMDARDQAGFEEVDAFASMTNGATADGQLLVGLYTDMDKNRGRGYVVSGGTFIPFDVPASTFTAAWDVNARGDVVGVFRDAGGVHGFLWADLRFRAINYPAAAATRTFGINARGDMVGAYTDAAGRIHGFVASRSSEDD